MDDKEIINACSRELKVKEEDIIKTIKRFKNEIKEMEEEISIFKSELS